MRLLTPLLFVTALMLALPGWARPIGAGKPYEDRTPEEIRAEVDRLEQELETASRLAGVAYTLPEKEQKKELTITPETIVKPVSEPRVVEGNLQRAKPQRKLRAIRNQAAEQTKQMTLEELRKATMRTLVHEEIVRNQMNNQQSSQNTKEDNRSGKSGPTVTVGEDGLREYEIDLPLAVSSNKKGHHRMHKEKVKIRVKPQVMSIHNQVQGLNKMLIDDVVRLTGKSAQKQNIRTTK